MTWIGVVSSASFFLSLLIIPFVIGRLDTDFFLHIHDPRVARDEHPLLFILIRSLRYLLGSILILAGIIMLFLPGQGILTMILGASLLDFPGRKKAIDAFLHQRAIQKSLNWIRRKEGKPPFSFTKTNR